MERSSTLGSKLEFLHYYWKSKPIPLTNDVAATVPKATAHKTGSSIGLLRVKRKSSPGTTAVFVATLVMAATSSNAPGISSINVNKLVL